MFYAGYQFDSIGNPGGTGFDPMTLTFYDASFGVVTSWAWVLGDGTTATGPAVTHTYAAEGIYTVTLSIVTANGAESTITMEVYAGAFPGLNPTARPCSCLCPTAPETVSSSMICRFLPIRSNPGHGISATARPEAKQMPIMFMPEGGVYVVTLTITAVQFIGVIRI